MKTIDRYILEKFQITKDSKLEIEKFVFNVDDKKMSIELPFKLRMFNNKKEYCFTVNHIVKGQNTNSGGITLYSFYIGNSPSDKNLLLLLPSYRIKALLLSSEKNPEQLSIRNTINTLNDQDKSDFITDMKVYIDKDTWYEID